MRLLLYAYPRRWRDRYADELLALLEAEPVKWRVRANVVASGLREHLRASGQPHLRVLWAWSLFVIGGMAFQKTSEHWQTVVPDGHRDVPTVAFDVVQAAAAVGSAVILAGIVLALPAFVRDLRHGGWPTLRRSILLAAAATVVSAVALVALALDHDIVAASVFVVFAVVALFAWTHAAASAARRLPPVHAHAYLALTVVTSMVVMLIASAVWVAAVSAQASSFVGVAHLVVMAAFMLAGTTLAATGTVTSLRA